MTELEKTIEFLESEELYCLEQAEDCEVAKHYSRAIMILREKLEVIKSATTN